MPDETPTAVPIKLPVEDVLPIAQRLIAKRQHKWRMTTLAWEDVAQRLLIRVWKQYRLFDPAKAPFENWCNFLITNEWKNILRDILFKHSVPCISKGGCSFNQGGDSCGFTPSGLKCAECPLYARWQERKENEHHIEAPLSLNALAGEEREVIDTIKSSFLTQSDFFDVAKAKKQIDVIMLRKLNSFDRCVYRMLLIQHLTPKETSDKLKVRFRTRKLKEGEGVGYQSVLMKLSTFETMVRGIIDIGGIITDTPNL